VLLIHARLFTGTLVGEHIVNRAVSVFVVLFGTTSELWWRRNAGATWRGTALRFYRTRFVRLMIPLWATMALWWTVALALGLPLERPSRIALTFAGYLPWVGTGWFVTLALELVVLVPLVRPAVTRLGIPASLAVAACVTVLAHAYMHQSIALMRLLLWDRSAHVDLSYFYYFWIFAPAWAFAVVGGIAIGRRGVRFRGIEVAVASALVIGGGAVAQRMMITSSWRLVLMAALDLPLTVTLLAIAAREVPFVTRPLAWCGVHSWGLYLAQLLVHDTVHAFAVPEAADATLVRLAYVGVLLAGAAALVILAETCRARLAVCGGYDRGPR
jgi:peptidoglycan/LPS O-acetylase OafA/YrhL